MTYMRSLSICIDSVTSANGFIGAPVEPTRCTVFAIDRCPPFESSGDRIVGGIRNCGFVFVVDIVREFITEFLASGLNGGLEALKF